MSPRFINDIEIMQNMALLLEHYNAKERLLLTKQVNVYFMLPKSDRDKCTIANGSEELRAQILREALKDFTPTVNLSLLHHYDIDRVKGLFLILRKACIAFDPSVVRNILVHELNWPSEVATQVRKISKEIQRGVWPQSRGCYHSWKDDSVERWLTKACTEQKIDVPLELPS